MPAPSNPLLDTVEPVTCWTWSTDTTLRKISLDVLYAGLAPGLAGYYQIDLRIPIDNIRPSMQFSCNGEGPDNTNFYGSIRVKLP
jgi:uncharacterized protein (TIGR03437 family)